MSIILAGVELNPNMIWEERYARSNVAQAVKRTLGSRPVIYTQGQIAGESITLTAIEDQGWLLKSQVDSIQALSFVAGYTSTLTIGSETFNITFRHEDGPAVEFRPLITRAVPLDGDYFIGSIRLLTI